MERESAVSRNIILALILSVVIIVVAAVIVLVLFPPVPEVVPSFSANAERSGTLVYLYHDGGDPLWEGTTAFRINGVMVPRNAITFLHGQNWPWTEGETIRIDDSSVGTPESIAVIYTGGGNQMVVYSSQFGTLPATIPATFTPSPTVTGIQTTIRPTVSMTTPSTLLTTPATPVATATGTAPRPPEALFSGNPREGDVPLIVQFTDLSMGTPDTWLWSFGDGTTSTEQNPSHQYNSPGVYTVSLTVRNGYGTSSSTKTGYIAAGLLPVALFQTVPREGTAPLQVQFTDLSTGDPDRWIWNFGDGSGSNEQNPSHLYLDPGEYTVSLTISNQYGSNTRIQTSEVVVTSTPMHGVYLQQSSTGYLLPDGYFQFVVTGPGASIKIGGPEYLFTTGDLVQLFPGDVSSGSVTVNQNGIVGFSFPDVRMFVNGEAVQTGIVSGINVPMYSGLKSTFTIVIPPGDASMLLFVDGSKVPSSYSQQIVISGLGTDSSGSMFLSVRTRAISFRGGAEGFSVS
jgi:PKD repeat protein